MQKGWKDEDEEEGKKEKKGEMGKLEKKLKEMVGM